MHLASFAFVDPTMFLSTMTLKYGRHFGDNDQPNILTEPPFQDCRHMVLRGPSDGDWGSDGQQVDYQLLAEWPSARNLLADIGQKIKGHLGAENVQFGQVVVRSLNPGAVIPWHVEQSEYAKRHHCFQLLISPCSGGCWYSGGELLAPGVGNLTYVNHLVLNSAINLGPVPQISLVVDVRKPEKPTLQ